MPILDEAAIERFESKLYKDPNSGCWLWTAGLFSNGYGAFGYNKKTRRAHRVSWLIYKGSIPDELLILHKCDVPSCVNPNHLFLGTHAENMKDRDLKGRAASGNRNGWFGKGHLQKGASNANYDHTAYTFEHKKRGWRVRCTRAYLIATFKLNYTHVGSIISGKAETTGGWLLST